MSTISTVKNNQINEQNNIAAKKKQNNIDSVKKETQQPKTSTIVTLSGGAISAQDSVYSNVNTTNQSSVNNKESISNEKNNSIGTQTNLDNGTVSKENNRTTPSNSTRFVPFVDASSNSTQNESGTKKQPNIDVYA